jgi:hypothetical protein
VANWERCWEPNGERLDLDHYLEVLKHKPQAFWRSAPLRQAQEAGCWPAQYTELFLELKERLRESAAARQMVDVLLLHRRTRLSPTGAASARLVVSTSQLWQLIRLTLPPQGVRDGSFRWTDQVPHELGRGRHAT